MKKPRSTFKCPICELAVAPGEKAVECFFHNYFHNNRAKYKSDKELSNAFFKKYPDFKKKLQSDR